MFKCQNCQQSSRKRFTVVQSGRRVSYTNIVIGYSKTKERETHVQGWEIKQEQALCASCYQLQAHKPPLLEHTGKHITHVFHKR